jgi:DNA adenine methylase
LRAVHQYLTNNEITILNEDFEKVVAYATKGDFVYFDPPYDPVSDTSSFTGYNLDGFDRDNQVRLKQAFDHLSNKGCKVLLSNSATPFIRELYNEYTIATISANRAINSDALKRGKIDEILVMNYVP